jgi:predicted exporter
MNPFPKRGRVYAIVVWLGFVLCCGRVVSRASFTEDLSAFLPSSPTQEQRLLVDLIKDGMAARLILVGIEGADSEIRARISRDMVKRLRDDPAFSVVNNGGASSQERDRKFLFANRYLLSPAVTPERFSVAGLHAAIAESIEALASSAGLLLKSLLPSDPTGETIRLLGLIDSGFRPSTLHGVWASRDGSRTLLLASTLASGSDLDGQQQAIAAIRQAFEAAVTVRKAAKDTADATADPRLVMAGPGVFSVAARNTIKGEVIRLSILGSLIIFTLLLAIYRSLTTVVLGLLPVASGALVGVAAVSLGFDVVHGVTLGFGATLIGEAVDYSIYLFIQSQQDVNQPVHQWATHFWPTIRLGLLTSVFGFASLLLSGFPGLAQLGLYSIAGLLTAAAVTRFVLPALQPGAFCVRDFAPFGLWLSDYARRAHRLRWLPVAFLAAACVIIYMHRDTLWSHELSALSPLSVGDQALDAGLRADLGAPDVGYLAIVSGQDSEAALAAAEKQGESLQYLVVKGVIAGFETPARFLPSAGTQKARLASLPDQDELNRRLCGAVRGLPVQASRFAPFVADVEAARQRGPLRRADMEGTTLALSVDGLLLRQDRRWIALMPLRAPVSGPSAHLIDSALVRQAMAASGQADAWFVDIKREADRLYSGYLREAIELSLVGLAAIVVLLLLALRSPRRVGRVMAPLLLAVLVVIAGLALSGHKLTLLHLVGMLLIVAVGSNYALFFDRREGEEDGRISPRTMASLLFANIATVAGYGLLAFSPVPVLQAIGVTVGPGAILALVFSALLADLADS